MAACFFFENIVLRSWRRFSQARLQLILPLDLEVTSQEKDITYH